MKYLFLSLLMMNAIFFLWQYQQENHKTDDIPMEVFSDNAVARLVLVSELENIPVNKSAQPDELDHAEDQVPAQEVETQESQVFVCHTVGPFADMQSAAQASLMFNQSGVPAVTRTAEQKKFNGYWVHLPQENSLPSARKIFQDLKDRKISDISIVPIEGDKYVISLGVFSMEHTSRRRYSQFVSMGYAPVVEDRYQINTTIWVDVKDSEPSLLAPGIWQNLAEKFSGIGHQEIAC